MLSDGYKIMYHIKWICGLLQMNEKLSLIHNSIFYTWNYPIQQNSNILGW